MNKKEKFIIFVYLAAMARDSESKTAEAARIAALASRITDEVLPENTYNSAQVYVNYCHGRSRAFKWMKNIGLRRVRTKSGHQPAGSASALTQRHRAAETQRAAQKDDATDKTEEDSRRRA